jgi:hypothetical protein
MARNIKAMKMDTLTHEKKRNTTSGHTTIMTRETYNIARPAVITILRLLLLLYPDVILNKDVRAISIIIIIAGRQFAKPG